ncbi:MAG TPA: aminotransferase class V-fold PLP-dependent enzyme, partial [Polyangiaceae bacterium]|nr:aminotransferase class V-fold PLP-dependent enzyme [Polyangiaceae bacterium]
MMISVSEYLGLEGDERRAGDAVALIGGHYPFPGAPDAFAIDSMRETLLIGERVRGGGNALREWVFLDDIAASEACSSVGCSAPGFAPRIQSSALPAVSAWLERRLPEIEQACAGGAMPQWREWAAELAQVLLQLDLPLPSLARDAVDPAQASLEEWLHAVEVLCYVADRPRFRPLQLSRAVRKVLPPVLLERSMTNAASRMLHKLKNREQSSSGGLMVTASREGVTSYWVAAADGRKIELRTETKSANGERAANKCAAILSQLFHHCAKQAAPPSRAARLELFYLIPCYDRSRVGDGAYAFARLYSDIRRWFGLEELRIATALYCSPERDRLLCDELRMSSAGAVERRTFELSALRSRREQTAKRSPMARQVYADNNATTAIDPIVLAELLPYMTGAYGNASSSHSYGWDAELAVGRAAREVAALIAAEPDEIFFTSGATEANNWVLRGIEGMRPIVTSAVEHKSVLEAASHAELSGRNVLRLPVDGDGQVELPALAALELPAGSLVSL